MALIKISDVSVDKADNAALNQGYLYKDLFLDIVNRVSYNKQLNRTTELRDVQGLYDIGAIKNSIVNIMLTSPGQKILSPRFGIDLRRHLFEPVSEFTSFEIRSDIKDRLPALEPRISLERIGVKANIDNQEYRISLQINVPSLDITGLSLKSILNSSGYTIV